ncbi:MAG: FlgO family outer membrane protein [Elusimicrobiota bacterium]
MTKTTRAGWRTGAFALLLAAPSAFGGDFDKLAGQLSRAAKSHGRSRVAILPFQVIGGRGTTSGRIVSERLVGPLMSGGDVEVVERSMLETVMREQQLQFSGAVDARSVKELGKILNVDAVITGTVIALKNDRVEVNARLIDAESAKVLFAAETKVEKDWNESLFDDSAWSGGSQWPAVPNFDLAASASAADWGCVGIPDQIDDLERSILDLKARFWAQKLRAGLNGSELKTNPGSEIRNPEIRADFYKSLTVQSSAIGPDLNDDEMAKLKSALERIARLNDSCRGEGS